MPNTWLAKIGRSGCLLVLIASATNATAGQVYGTVLSSNKPLDKAIVKVTCPGNVVAQSTSDAYGSYSLYVDASGRCKISVNGSNDISLRVYDDDVRADLRLTGTTLSRK